MPYISKVLYVIRMGGYPQSLAFYLIRGINMNTIIKAREVFIKLVNEHFVDFRVKSTPASYTTQFKKKLLKFKEKQGLEFIFNGFGIKSGWAYTTFYISIVNDVTALPVLLDNAKDILSLWAVNQMNIEDLEKVEELEVVWKR